MSDGVFVDETGNVVHTTSRTAPYSVTPSSHYDDDEDDDNDGSIHVNNYTEEYKSDTLPMSESDYSKQLFPFPGGPDVVNANGSASRSPTATQSATFIQAKTKRERDTFLKWQSESPQERFTDLRVGNTGLYYNRENKLDNGQESATRTILMDAVVVDVVDEDGPLTEAERKELGYTDSSSKHGGHGSDFNGMTDVDLSDGQDGYQEYSTLSFHRFRNVRMMRLIIWIAVSVLIVSVTLAQIVHHAANKRDEASSSSSSSVEQNFTPPGHLNATHLNATHINATHINATHINATHINATHINATHINATHINATHAAIHQKTLATADDWVNEALRLGWSEHEDLKNVEGPQYAAIQWLSGPANVAQEQDVILLQERYAASVLYFALGGTKWHIGHANFFVHAASICQWFHVIHDKELDIMVKFGLDCTCDNVDDLDKAHCRQDGRHDTVKRITLSSMGLEGSLPHEIYLFDSLIEIEFNHNRIQGTLPLPKHAKTHIRQIGLSDNRLEGPLQSWMANFPSLRYLDVSKNAFDDDISHLISSEMAQLEVFNANSNRNIRAELSVFRNMAQLKALLLSDNMISGEVNGLFVESLPSLQILDVSKNGLDGILMSGIINHPSLAVLDLHRNDLTGAFPEIDTTQTRLRFLSLRDNKLEGTIPLSIVGMKDTLHHLDLGRNLLTGTMPAMLSGLDLLEYLDLSFINWDEGQIPTDYVNLHNIRYLALQETDRTGELSYAMVEGWPLLETLDLGRNLLGGMLPTNLGSGTPNLKQVVLYHNTFQGELLPLENAPALEKAILNGGNSWDDNVELQGFCAKEDFPLLQTFLIRPCTNVESEAEILLPYCSCCQCCPNATGCEEHHWFVDSENAWDTGYTWRHFRGREIMLTEEELIALTGKA